MLSRFLPWKKSRPGYLPASRIGRPHTPGLVSVVLPVFNGARYLGEAIESVLGQTWQDWELIVVDDGSTDGSGAIAAQYAARDRRVRLITQENQKLPRALNRGFGEAAGEFFTWISADNRMLPGCLASMAEALRHSPDADMVTGNMFLIGPTGQRLRGHGWFELPPGSGNVILPASTALLNTVANNTIGAAFLYRGSVDAVLGGYSPRQFMLEDYDYFMRLNSLFHIRHLSQKEPIYAYRMHPDSLTARDEALGITAARPRLMAFDARRRAFYQTPLYARTELSVPGLGPALQRAGIRTADTPEERDQLAKRHPGRVFCLAGPDRPFPRESGGIPRYILDLSQGWRLLLPERAARPGFYGGIRGPFSFSTQEDLALFLRLRAACDLLWQEERRFFT